MTDGNLKRDLEFFIEHQNELVQKYRGKFLVIKDQNVEGAYNSEIEAYREGQKTYKLGTFSIQPCFPGPEAYTQVFHSRGLFR